MTVRRIVRLLRICGPTSALLVSSFLVSQLTTAQERTAATRDTRLQPETVSTPYVYGGTDVDVVAGGESGVHITQGSSSAWGHGNTVVVAYDDSTMAAQPHLSACGMSVSTDGGATFTRLAEHFNSTSGCYGDITVAYSVKAAKWFAAMLTDTCGNGGIKGYGSSDAVNWTALTNCVQTSTSTGSPDIWIDNNASSPYYGSLYVFFNNFNVGQGNISVARSANDGATWTTAVPYPNSGGVFRRMVKGTGSLGTDGTIYAEELSEGAGGLSGIRQGFVQRSTDGGATWTTGVAETPTFTGPGAAACSDNSYYPCMFSVPTTLWRDMGWGSLAVGPSGVLHYVYSVHGTSSDIGDIYYTRSADSGATWSTPVKMNTDGAAKAQWQPAISANASGFVFMDWFDMRNSSGPPTIEVFGRSSTDNGATWNADSAVSDVAFPLPNQPDSSIQASYLGIFHHSMFNNDGTGDTAYVTWTDGRVPVSNAPQPDVFFDKVRLVTPGSVVTVSGRVHLAGGRGITNAQVTVSAGDLQNPVTVRSNRRGMYTVGNLHAGQFYNVSVTTKRFTFSLPSRAVNPIGDMTGVDFTANQ